MSADHDDVRTELKQCEHTLRLATNQIEGVQKLLEQHAPWVFENEHTTIVEGVRLLLAAANGVGLILHPSSLPEAFVDSTADRAMEWARGVLAKNVAGMAKP